jgi:hypothetical protein
MAHFRLVDASHGAAPPEQDCGHGPGGEGAGEQGAHAAVTAGIHAARRTAAHAAAHSSQRTHAPVDCSWRRECGEDRRGVASGEEAVLISAPSGSTPALAHPASQRCVRVGNKQRCRRRARPREQRAGGSPVGWSGARRGRTIVDLPQAHVKGPVAVVVGRVRVAAALVIHDALAARLAPATWMHGDGEEWGNEAKGGGAVGRYRPSGGRAAALAATACGQRLSAPPGGRIAALQAGRWRNQQKARNAPLRMMKTDTGLRWGALRLPVSAGGRASHARQPRCCAPDPWPPAPSTAPDTHCTASTRMRCPPFRRWSRTGTSCTRGGGTRAGRERAC